MEGSKSIVLHYGNHWEEVAKGTCWWSLSRCLPSSLCTLWEPLSKTIIIREKENIQKTQSHFLNPGQWASGHLQHGFKLWEIIVYIFWTRIQIPHQIFTIGGQGWKRLCQANDYWVKDAGEHPHHLYLCPLLRSKRKSPSQLKNQPFSANLKFSPSFFF